MAGTCNRGDLSSRIWEEARGASAGAERDHGFDDELQDRPSLFAQASGHRQHPLDKPRTFLAVRTEATLAPKNRWPDFLLARVIRCALIRRMDCPGEIPGRLTHAPTGSTWGGSGGDE